MIDKDVDELDPHLDAFAKHGGKLLLYHGWADQQVAPGATVEFYQSLLNVNRDAGSDWVRLFMAPGMAHCSGGEGPDTFDKIGTLEDWVERGNIPSRIIAAHHSSSQVDRTRPLCAYPQVAKYKGSGSIDEAANFVCSTK
jgi:feruloyl esterase